MRNLYRSKANREFIEKKYGLTDSCGIVRVFLTSTQKEELLEHVYYTDARTFINIAKSQYFYLTQNSNLNFEVFCSVKAPDVPICIEMLNDKRFIHIRIEEKYLLRFLRIITPLRVVDLDEA